MTVPDRLLSRRVYGDALASSLENVAARYRELGESLTGLVKQVPELGQATSAGRTKTASALVAEVLRLIVYAESNASLPGLVLRAAEYDHGVAEPPPPTV